MIFFCSKKLEKIEKITDKIQLNDKFHIVASQLKIVNQAQTQFTKKQRKQTFNLKKDNKYGQFKFKQKHWHVHNINKQQSKH